MAALSGGYSSAVARAAATQARRMPQRAQLIGTASRNRQAVKVALQGKEYRHAAERLKWQLRRNNLEGLFDLVSQGFNVAKDMAPKALQASIEKKIAATQAKAAAARAAAANPTPAKPRAVSVTTLQPEAAGSVRVDWSKPALIAGGLVAGGLVLSRLMPAGRAN